MDYLNFASLLFNIGVIIWIFPAIRQFRGSIFYYFLILALADPIFYVHTTLFNAVGSNFLILTLNFLLFLSILSKKELHRYRFILAGFFILAILVLVFDSNYQTAYSFVVLLRLSIFVKFFIIFIQKNVEDNAASIFYIVLLIYELTNIFKFSNFVFGITNATAYFIITSFFQILIGIYFSIFKEDSPKNLIRL